MLGVSNKSDCHLAKLIPKILPLQVSRQFWHEMSLPALPKATPIVYFTLLKLLVPANYYSHKEIGKYEQKTNKISTNDKISNDILSSIAGLCFMFGIFNLKILKFDNKMVLIKGILFVYHQLALFL